MSQVTLSNQSTWASKLKAMGPGILMASAAVGGSHIVSSTQAGGSYGWSLLLLVILANVFKYPFFRFGAEYTADTGKTLVEGYAEKRKLYLWIFFILNVFSAMVNTRGVCSVATTKKRVKILDFKLFYKHFVFVDKGNFDIKKVLKRHIDVNVFVDIVCVSEK